jgi:hypothetical protein
MMVLRVFILSLLAFTLVACGDSSPPTVGEARDFTSACAKANDGKRIAVEGYLRFPDSFSGKGSVVLRLYQADDYTGKPIGVQTEIGTAANHVEEVQKQFSDTDLKVHLASGQVSGFGEKVKVSGKVYYPLVAQEFDCALENPLVEVKK